MNTLSQNPHQSATKLSSDQDISVKQNYETLPAKFKGIPVKLYQRDFQRLNFIILINMISGLAHVSQCTCIAGKTVGERKRGRGPRGLADLGS